jgi:hypothetical protein
MGNSVSRLLGNFCRITREIDAERAKPRTRVNKNRLSTLYARRKRCKALVDALIEKVRLHEKETH